MISVILAHDIMYGIGKEGKLPWHFPEDLKLFQSITKGGILIAGRKTAELLPPLPGRYLYTLSRSGKFKSITEIIEDINNSPHLRSLPIFVIGGAQIYEEIMKNHSTMIKYVHISAINSIHACDTIFNPYPYLIDNWVMTSEVIYTDFSYRCFSRINHEEENYLTLLREVSMYGNERKTRNSTVKSVFSRNLTFDLRNGFPLLTTKKMFFTGIVEEFLFFLRGDTDSKKLEEKGVNIWKGNTSREFLDKSGFHDRAEGEMGPMYGYQWRTFGKPFSEKKSSVSPTDLELASETKETGLDQLAEVVHLIKTDPTSRRIMMTTYNPIQAKEGVLYPCHSIITQFYVNDGVLDLFCYNRSQDLFLGTPFNIASSALLLEVVAIMTSLKPGLLHLSLGDTHIYDNHREVVQEQLKRVPYPFPALTIPRFVELERIPDLTISDFILTNYRCHPGIKAGMIA